MSAIGDAVADTFRKHPFGMSVAGLIALSIVFSNVSDIFDEDTLPESMTCEITDSDYEVTNGFQVYIGTKNETLVSIPAEDLQKLGKAPIRFTCEAN